MHLYNYLIKEISTNSYFININYASTVKKNFFNVNKIHFNNLFRINIVMKRQR